MSEEKFTLVFDGAAVEGHKIDVKDLGFTLIAMGDLIHAANSEINGDKSPVSVKVQAHKPGSFEVVFVLQSIAESLKPLMDFAEQNKEGISAANELMDLLFKIGTLGAAPFAGLWGLLKWLKGRKPDKVEKQKNGDYRIYVENTYIVINAKTKKLAESIKVRKFTKTAVSALSHAGINAIKIKRPAEKDLEVTKSEVGYFNFQEEEEEINEETRPMTLQIGKLSFEDKKWRMTDGGESFSATIEDVDFLNKVANAEISFSSGDYLECLVRETQFRTTSGLKKERAIIKVNNHTPAAQQLRLI